MTRGDTLTYLDGMTAYALAALPNCSRAGEVDPCQNRSDAHVTVDALVAKGRDLLREYAKDGADRTAVLRNLAAVLVDLRRCFGVANGRTDWTGRSHGYREAVARMYHEAGVPSGALPRSALRYHVGNVLRDVVPADELVDAGLDPKKPIARSRDTRDRLSALARAGANRNADIPTVRRIVQAEVLLVGVEDPTPETMPDPAVVEDVVASLEVISRRAQSLLHDFEPLRKLRRGGRRRLEAVTPEQ